MTRSSGRAAERGMEGMRFLNREVNELLSDLES